MKDAWHRTLREWAKSGDSPGRAYRFGDYARYLDARSADPNPCPRTRLLDPSSSDGTPACATTPRITLSR